MLKNSCILSFLSWLHSVIKNSFIFRFIERIITNIADCYAKSNFKKILSGKAPLEDSSQGSWFYRALSAVSKPFLWFFKKLSAISQTSAILKMFKGAVSDSAILRNVFDIPFLCCVIFLIPHDYWNNLYALALALIVFIMAIFKRPKSEKRSFPTVWLSFLLFVGAAAFSAVVSYNRADSIRIFMFFVTAFLMCLGIYFYLCDAERLKKFLSWMFFAALISSLFAYVQRAMGIEVDPLLTDMNVNEGMPGRAFSTMGNPNNYAQFLILFIPFGFAFMSNHKKSGKKLFALLGIAICLGALLLTYSRSGWIAFAAALLVYVALYEKKYLPYLAVAVIVIIPFLPESITNRILTIGNLEDTSSAYRLTIWTAALNMLKDYWVTGIGLGNGAFKLIYPQYSLAGSTIAPHSHMQFMEMFIELGILGFIIYICFSFLLIRRSCVASGCKDKLIRSSCIASAAAMTGFVLVGIFEYCWFYPRVLFAFFLCAGVAMAAVNLSRKESQK